MKVKFLVTKKVTLKKRHKEMNYSIHAGKLFVELREYIANVASWRRG